MDDGVVDDVRTVDIERVDAGAAVLIKLVVGNKYSPKVRSMPGGEPGINNRAVAIAVSAGAGGLDIGLVVVGTIAEPIMAVSAGSAFKARRCERRNSGRSVDRPKTIVVSAVVLDKEPVGINHGNTAT